MEHACKACGITQPCTSYYKEKNMTSGYQSTCKKCVRARSKRNRALKPEKYAATVAAWSRNNLAQRTARHNKAKQANPIHYAQIAGKGLAVQRGASVSAIYCPMLCAAFYEEARRLTLETGVPHEVDHIVPVSKGGLHCQTNLQVLTKLANRAKSNT